MSNFILFLVKILRINQIQEIFLSNQIIMYIYLYIYYVYYCIFCILCNKNIQNLVLSQ